MNGNGWTINETPYLTVDGGQQGNSGGTYVDTAPERISVVVGGTASFSFTINSASSYSAWGADRVTLTRDTSGTPDVLRLTDPNGNVTEFFDVRRDGSDFPQRGSLANDLSSKYGKFKSYTSAEGTTSIVATYDGGGKVIALTRTDSVTSSSERIAYTYVDVTNDLVGAGTPATLIGSASLQRPDGSANWQTVRRIDYEYYTGRVPNGSGGFNNDPNGRLGDLKLAVTSDFQAQPSRQTASSLTRSGSTATATITGHGYAVGDWVVLTNAAQPEYNGRFAITAVTSNTFSYAVPGTPASPATALTGTSIYATKPTDVAYYRYYKFLGESYAGNADGGPTTPSQSQGPTNDIATTGGPAAIDTNEFVYADLKFVTSGMKSVVQGAAFDRLRANYADFEAVPDSDANLSTDANGDGDATNDSVKAYVNNFFTYERWGDHTNLSVDSGTASSSSWIYMSAGGFINNSPFVTSYRLGTRYRVTTEIAQGAGCSTCTGGMGTFGFAYKTNELSTGLGFGTLDYNIWRMRTTETLPDADPSDLTNNDLNIVYTNELGMPMLEVLVDRNGTSSTGDDRAYPTYYQYDGQGRLVLKAHPSAVVTYDPASPSTFEQYADLVNFSGSTATNLNNSTGLIETVTYGTSTTATSSTPGDVLGYVKSVGVKNGDTGTDILQSSKTYLSRTDSTTGAVVYPVATETRYRNTNGTGGQTVSYAYTWVGTTTRLASATGTLPTVTTAQNGSNAGTTGTVVYDVYGRPTWTKDAEGFITKTTYDVKTGGVSEYIVDVNTTTTTDEPSGWTTPSGGGLHLTTSYEFDGLGRTTKVTDPNGDVTYRVYNDASHEVRTYRGWSGSGSTGSTTGPIEVTRTYRPAAGASSGQRTVYTETLTTSATPTTVSGAPTGTEVINAGNIQSLTRSLTNDAGQVVKTDAYTSLTSITYARADAALGTLGTNYLRTLTDYNGRGWLKRVEDPNGTIRRTEYDARGNRVSAWVGTDDVPTSGFWSPSNNAGANMLKVSENVYDNGGVGNGNLTESRAVFGSGGSDLYATTYAYDFRDRLILQRGPDKIADAYTLDNLGQATQVDRFADADTDGVIDSTELRGRSLAEYDERGQVFRSKVTEVDPTTGAASDTLATDYWYNARGMLMKTSTASGLFQKTSYDGAGRPVATYMSYDDTENASPTYAAASTVSGDTVIEQNKTIYDAAGRPVTMTSYKDMSGSPSTGALGANDSFIATSVMWYDKAGRPIATAAYGRDNGITNGTSGGTRYVFNSSGVLIDTDSDGLPDEAENTPRAPNTSDDYIVTKTEYDAAGRAFRQTDNMGRITETTFDLLGRQTKLVENYINGVATETETDTDSTTIWTYDTQGRLSKMTAKNPKGSGAGVEDQDTKYLYESTIDAGLVTNTIYPDSSDTTSSGTDQVKATFDRLGRQVTSTDQRGVVHTYTYDSAGRVSADAITTLPSGVDGGVRRIERTYDDLSRVQKVTSYDAATGGSVVNEVAYTYDGWGNVTKAEQAHDGAVVPSTTPATTYNYVDGATGGVASYVRLASEGYANGYLVYHYSNSGSKEHYLNVASTYSDFQSTYVTTERVGASVVGAIYGYRMRLNHGTSTNLDGLDRFGRIVEQRWRTYGDALDIDTIGYTYDRNGNRLTRDVRTGANGTPGTTQVTGHDQAYTYDGLNRLVGFARGTLSSGTLGSINFSQNWNTLDSLGNWQSFDEDTNGSTSGGSTTYNRTHNAANETTDSGSTWIDPAYDAAGNMTTAPVAGNETTAQYYIYDGWNRLVGMSLNSDGDFTDTGEYRYEYDGVGRRVQKDKAGGTSNDEDFYYNEKSQLLEIRRGGSNNAESLFVWGPDYIDAALIQRHDANSDGDFNDTNEVLYAAYDANYNVTALLNANDNIVERYSYTPYGERTVLDANYAADADGISDVNFNLGHQGLLHDAETGLVYNRARMLHVTLGRFLSRDYMVGYLDGVNLYQYERSAPANGVDPNGTLFCKCSAGLAPVPAAACGPMNVGALTNTKSGLGLCYSWVSLLCPGLPCTGVCKNITYWRCALITPGTGLAGFGWRVSFSFNTCFGI